MKFGAIISLAAHTARTMVNKAAGWGKRLICGSIQIYF
jgi:hypothetical protein